MRVEIQKMDSRTLEKVLDSDENHFFIQGQRSQHVQKSPHKNIRTAHIDQNIKHPQRRCFWGCFSYFGIGSLYPVEGMMYSPQYIEVISRKVVPELKKICSLMDPAFYNKIDPLVTHQNKWRNFFIRIKLTYWIGLGTNRKFVVYL